MDTNTRKVDFAAQLALFLLEHTGSIWGRFRGKMPAAQQRALFGRFIGKGDIIINGEEETVEMIRRVCFGTDWDRVGYTKWAAL
jgi:hypothetical protein